MIRPRLYIAATWRPPVATPIADEVAALPMSKETAHRIAREWLEDIAAVEQAKGGISPAAGQPASDGDACDVCHGDPAECGHIQDDDEWPDNWATGAFPVVAVA